MSVLGVRDCVGGKPLDAMADAAQLRLIAGELSWDDDLAYAVWTLIGEAEVCPSDSAPARAYRRDAHAAFEACPALREEA